MFHNRLKTFLLILLIVTALLMLRALQLQVFNRNAWADRAAKAFAPPAQLTETTRGRILDFRGREVAVDRPCLDLCVDYRAITAPAPGDDGPVDPDVAKWLRTVAIRRLGSDYTEATRSDRAELLADEIRRVRADIHAMWMTLADASGKTFEEIDETRRAVIQRVEMRRRYVWVHRWRAAVVKQEALPQAPWYQRWLMGESDDRLALDSFDLTVGEQRDAHVILADVGTDLANFFGKDPDKYPGLILRPGIKRVYPYDEAGCHLIGHLSKVNREDILANDDEDELRMYLPNDEIGRTGVEALAEPLLRGSRGRIVRQEGKETENTPFKPGQDVHLTIDIELQREIQAMFKHVAIGSKGQISYHTMHGAAVVVDVPTGEVRALASYPDFDLNRFDDDYSKLAGDTLNSPLLNRATQVAREPGSTAKPMVGLGAIMAGLVTPTTGIECTGFLRLDGKQYSVGKCWVVSTARSNGLDFWSHHPFPIAHRGHDGNPDGFLTFADALERSCNVYFETLGDRLKTDGLSRIFHTFGLGRPTGIGIAEVAGSVPSDRHDPEYLRRSLSWFSAIGQARVYATPIQMANVAATIARDGVWMKPHLLVDGTNLPPRKPTSQPADKLAPAEDRIDLRVPPAAIRAAKQGMYNVVYAPAGTGPFVASRDENIHSLDPALAHIHIAGKTGTAQASRVRVPVLDADGVPTVDEEGKPVTKFLQPSLPGRPNPEADWYRATDAEGEHFNHAWFIGFAPAEHPQVAFAVMVEYGESGGSTAGRLAKHVVEACIEHGYLPAAANRKKEVAGRD